MTTKNTPGIDFNDPLRAVFGRKLSRREVVWLWLALRDESDYADPGEFGAPDMEARMTGIILRFSLKEKLIERHKATMLPEHAFEWIKNDRRQLNWLDWSLRYDRTPGCFTNTPVALSIRDTVVALLDYKNQSTQNKIYQINGLKAQWSLLQEEDKFFSWFKTSGNTKLKCQTAWDWYISHNLFRFRHPHRFSNLEDIFLFLDTSNFKIDEKRFHIEEIKKEWKRNQVKKNLNGKKQTNLALSDEARRKLDQLAEMWGQTMVTVVERLILEAHKENAENFAQSKKFRF
ncbi:hypothetical protein [Paraburkholderia kururiensis]|uniref:hypothetical protein n=1 Tax=Paraburkholderia kururiensis TaxID=984307 RepID=UPI0018F318E0|nr:hypothetical protein [Paraburkholderia kururiensis]